MSDDRTCTLCGGENNQSLTIYADGTQTCRDCSDKLHEWERAVDAAETAAMGGPIPQRCPRRDEMFQQGGPPDELPDEWSLREPLGGAGERFLVCNYCGSLHPDVFMEKLREGWIAGPTDKNYKTYLGRPFTDEEIEVRKQQWLNGTLVDAMRATGAEMGKTPEEIDAEIEHDWQEHHAPLTTDRDVAKFYFPHLSKAQRLEFVDMLNVKNGHPDLAPDGTPPLRVGYPGHFYAPPFFISR
jgi:hypothetical protein